MKSLNNINLNSKLSIQKPTLQKVDDNCNQVLSILQNAQHSLAIEDRKFIEILIQEWLLHRLTELSAYHVSPTYNQESIKKNGLNNHATLLTSEQKELFIELIKRLPPRDQFSYRDRLGLIFGDNNFKRWVYISFHRSLENYYMISESVRLYFCDINEYFELLHSDEQKLVINWFKDFHRKFSKWRDVWRIQASENPELLSIVLPIIRKYYNLFPELLKEKKNSNIGSDIYIHQGISPSGIYLEKTEQLSPTDMWTQRCEKFISRLE